MSSLMHILTWELAIDRCAAATERQFLRLPGHV